MEEHGLPISMWRWLPFEMPDGEVRRYLVSSEGFDAAVYALFGTGYGGGSVDGSRVNMIRAVKRKACDAGDYVSIADEIAELFAESGVGRYVGAAVGQAANLRGGPGQELAVLDALCSEGELYPEGVAERACLGEGAVRDCLSRLLRCGLVVAKADGRHVLTQEGVLAWAELKYEGGPVGDMDAMLEITQRWQGALCSVHGFEEEAEGRERWERLLLGLDDLPDAPPES